MTGGIRAMLAERSVATMRLAVVLVASVSYPFLPAANRGDDRAALALLAVCWTYSATATVFSGARRRSLVRIGTLLAFIDGVLLTACIGITGGILSPYYICYYLALIASAVQIPLPRFLAIAVFYFGLYTAVALSGEGLPVADGFAALLGIRLAYLVVSASICALIARENARKIRSKVVAESAVRESIRREAWLKSARGKLEAEVRRRTDDLATANAALLFEVQQREAAQAALAAAKNEAERANMSKTDFLAAMSHEIRTPLGAVVGFAELLGQPGLAEEKRAKYLETIMRNSTMLSRIVSDILDLSRVEAGRLDLEALSVSLRDLLADVQTSMAPEAESKGLTLTVVVDDDLPARFVSDPMRLRQIVLNLVANAVKFTARGSVRIMAERKEERLVIRVDDTGPGLDQEQRARLFMAFGQGDISTARIYGGSGLGLVLSRRLAVALGGELTLVSSTPGVGSSFALILPLAPESQTAAASLDAPGSGQLAGVDVLLVDDFQDNLLLLKVMLAKSGAKLRLATNGQQAIDEVLRANPDAIVMDLQMPVLDGHEATRRLRKMGYGGAIIAVTAHALEQHRISSFAAGCDDHLTKPVDRAQLVDAIGRHIAARKSRLVPISSPSESLSNQGAHL